MTRYQQLVKTQEEAEARFEQAKREANALLTQTKEACRRSRDWCHRSSQLHGSPLFTATMAEAKSALETAEELARRYEEAENRAREWCRKSIESVQAIIDFLEHAEGEQP